MTDKPVSTDELVVAREALIGDIRTLAGYAITAGPGRVRFVISLKSNDGAMRFQLLRVIEAGL